jgi:RHS repeat-associated protein
VPASTSSTNYQDSVGKVVNTYGSEVTEYQLDNFGYLGSEKRGNVTVGYEYYPDGKKKKVTAPGGETEYTYDLQGRLCAVISGNKTTKYMRRADGLVESINYPNGAKATFEYHENDLVKTITHNDKNGALISRQAYGYDANGNVTNKTVNRPGNETEITEYQPYDEADRLTGYKTTVNGVVTDDRAYAYEGYNRKSEAVSAGGPSWADRLLKTYNYDPQNRLTSYSIGAVPRGGTPYNGSRTVGYNLAYDSNGNTIQKEEVQAGDGAENSNTYYSHNSQNRLVRVTRARNIQPSELVAGDYQYNERGLRTQDGSRKYYYQGDDLIEEYDPVSNSLLAHYTRGESVISQDKENSGSQYYHHDALGSTVALTDNDGVEVADYVLDPWGNLKCELPTTTDNRTIFTGHQYDPDTGLHYFKARYYDSELPRFRTPDTYPGEIDTPQSFNRYLYAYSNPTVWVDPSGNCNVYADGTVDCMAPAEEAMAGTWKETKEAWHKNNYGTVIIGGALTAGGGAGWLYGKAADWTVAGAWNAGVQTGSGINEGNTNKAVKGGIGVLAIAIAGKFEKLIKPGAWSTAYNEVKGVFGKVRGIFTSKPKVVTQSYTEVASTVERATLIERPTDPYSPDWDKYYRQHPRELRAVGAEAAQNANEITSVGRQGKQVRLRELVDDPNVSSVDRGWIQQEINSIERGQRTNIRVPPGKNLAHRRGFEAKKGYSYEHSDLQDIDIHKLQHKHEGY